MCLIAFHLHQHPTYSLIMAANRDEFYDRPTAPAHFWPEHPELLAGKDLHANGTWLGITTSGRIAALTNYRDPLSVQEDLISRGEIVKDYLIGSSHPENFMMDLENQKTCYNGFNLLLGTSEELYYYSNMQNHTQHLQEGTHALSNKFLNTPWPKVDRARTQLSEFVEQHSIIDPEDLLTMMQHAEQAGDQQLPDTGVGLDLERKLSPMFIQMPNYGTRSSTVILVTHTGEVTFAERTYEDGRTVEYKTYRFKLDAEETN